MSRCLLAGFLIAGALSLGGCPVTGTTRLTNQGSGSLITAGLKIARDAINELNPDEIQILSDTVAPASNQPDFLLSDEQGQAIVDFLKANNIGSVDDLRAIIAQADADPGSIVIPDSVRELLDGGAFD